MSFIPILALAAAVFLMAAFILKITAHRLDVVWRGAVIRADRLCDARCTRLCRFTDPAEDRWHPKAILP